jgi:hypothetical protein
MYIYIYIYVCIYTHKTQILNEDEKTREEALSEIISWISSRTTSPPIKQLIHMHIHIRIHIHMFIHTLTTQILNEDEKTREEALSEIISWISTRTTSAPIKASSSSMQTPVNGSRAFNNGIQRSSSATGGNSTMISNNNYNGVHLSAQPIGQIVGGYGGPGSHGYGPGGNGLLNGNSSGIVPFMNFSSGYVSPTGVMNSSRAATPVVNLGYPRFTSDAKKPATMQNGDHFSGHNQNGHGDSGASQQNSYAAQRPYGVAPKA